ncbi:cytochrome c biogenesis protein CcdA [Mycobacterium sp. UM_Kg1]|uniref:cytochrome c biogenesis CcdA family protein n=1 Tax=Mycobacterium sp. UM_Kg1 TaxID=1545691 RepID=UPI00061AA3F3|nr:cytochrome c biogenesis protein CcdA [Mycobacterium sp. UM_Kg1]
MIDTAAVDFALGAGMVAALNPCGFAFLPGYLGLVIAGSGGTSRPVALGRAATATVVMATGFVTVFGIFGLAVSPLLASAQRYLPLATVVIGAGLLAAGIWLLTGRDIAVLVPRPLREAPTARLGSMYGYGVGYAVASLSCTVAPFLAVVSMTFRQGAALAGILAFAAYAVGMSITVGVAALAVAWAGSSATAALRRVLPHVGRIAGVLVVATGLYVGYYGCYEMRLYFTGADADDRVIGAASAVQSWLAGHVDALGAWPLLGAIGVLVAGALSRRALVRRRGTGDS